VAAEGVATSSGANDTFAKRGFELLLEVVMVVLLLLPPASGSKWLLLLAALLLLLSVAFIATIRLERKLRDEEKSREEE